MIGQDAEEPIDPVAFQGVLVDDGAGQEAEPGADGRLVLAAGDHHPGHDRGAGRGAADDPAAVEHRRKRRSTAVPR